MLIQTVFDRNVESILTKDHKIQLTEFIFICMEETSNLQEAIDLADSRATRLCGINIRLMMDEDTKQPHILISRVPLN